MNELKEGNENDVVDEEEDVYSSSSISESEESDSESYHDNENLNNNTKSPEQNSKFDSNCDEKLDSIETDSSKASTASEDQNHGENITHVSNGYQKTKKNVRNNHIEILAPEGFQAAYDQISGSLPISRISTLCPQMAESLQSVAKILFRELKKHDFNHNIVIALKSRSKRIQSMSVESVLDEAGIDSNEFKAKFRSNPQEREDLEAYIVLIAVLFVRKNKPDPWSSKYENLEIFRMTYPEFNDETDESSILKLMEFANVMHNVLRYMKGKGNQQRLLTLAACLAEGPNHSRYITGGAQSKKTSRRVCIFRKESNTSKVARPHRHAKSTDGRDSSKADSRNSSSGMLPSNLARAPTFYTNNNLINNFNASINMSNKIIPGQVIPPTGLSWYPGALPNHYISMNSTQRGIPVFPSNMIPMSMSVPMSLQVPLGLPLQNSSLPVPLQSPSVWPYGYPPVTNGISPTSTVLPTDPSTYPYGMTTINGPTTSLSSNSPLLTTYSSYPLPPNTTTSNILLPGIGIGGPTSGCDTNGTTLMRSDSLPMGGYTTLSNPINTSLLSPNPMMNSSPPMISVRPLLDPTSLPPRGTEREVYPGASNPLTSNSTILHAFPQPMTAHPHYPLLPPSYMNPMDDSSLSTTTTMSSMNHHLPITNQYTSSSKKSNKKSLQDNNMECILKAYVSAAKGIPDMCNGYYLRIIVDWNEKFIGYSELVKYSIEHKNKSIRWDNDVFEIRIPRTFKLKDAKLDIKLWRVDVERQEVIEIGVLSLAGTKLLAFIGCPIGQMNYENEGLIDLISTTKKSKRKSSTTSPTSYDCTGKETWMLLNDQQTISETTTNHNNNNKELCLLVRGKFRTIYRNSNNKPSNQKLSESNVNKHNSNYNNHTNHQNNSPILSHMKNNTSYNNHHHTTTSPLSQTRYSSLETEEQQEMQEHDMITNHHHHHPSLTTMTTSSTTNPVDSTTTNFTITSYHNNNTNSNERNVSTYYEKSIDGDVSTTPTLTSYGSESYSNNLSPSLVANTKALYRTKSKDTSSSNNSPSQVSLKSLTGSTTIQALPVSRQNNEINNSNIISNKFLQESDDFDNSDDLKWNKSTTRRVEIESKSSSGSSTANSSSSNSSDSRSAGDRNSMFISGTTTTATTNQLLATTTTTAEKSSSSPITERLYGASSKIRTSSVGAMSMSTGVMTGNVMLTNPMRAVSYYDTTGNSMTSVSAMMPNSYVEVSSMPPASPYTMNTPVPMMLPVNMNVMPTVGLPLPDGGGGVSMLPRNTLYSTPMAVPMMGMGMYAPMMSVPQSRGNVGGMVPVRLPPPTASTIVQQQQSQSQQQIGMNLMSLPNNVNGTLTPMNTNKLPIGIRPTSIPIPTHPHPMLPMGSGYHPQPINEFHSLPTTYNTNDTTPYYSLPTMQYAVPYGMPPTIYPPVTTNPYGYNTNLSMEETSRKRGRGTNYNPFSIENDRNHTVNKRRVDNNGFPYLQLPAVATTTPITTSTEFYNQQLQLQGKYVYENTMNNSNNNNNNNNNEDDEEEDCAERELAEATADFLIGEEADNNNNNNNNNNNSLGMKNGFLEEDGNNSSNSSEGEKGGTGGGDSAHIRTAVHTLLSLSGNN